MNKSLLFLLLLITASSLFADFKFDESTGKYYCVNAGKPKSIDQEEYDRLFRAAMADARDMYGQFSWYKFFYYLNLIDSPTAEQLIRDVQKINNSTAALCGR